jgi:hypothetical protein
MTAVSDRAKLHLAFGLSLLLGGCTAAPGQDGDAVPVYDQQTGRLERLESDRDGDGRVDATAFMDGTRIEYVEIDTNADGAADRWEYYVPNPSGEPGPGSPDGRNLLARAEERAGPEQPLTRLETYVAGVVSRVEEDTDGDGRMDKWEHYVDGRLERVELDLQGKGFPDRRLVYGTGGSVVRVEADPDGDGVFVIVK